MINHGKHKFWGVPQMHYHQGMKAGENTLNALCMRECDARMGADQRRVGSRSVGGGHAVIQS